MGSVFLGVDEELAGRQVAIKFMTLGRDETALKRFQREAEVTAQLDHPHVIRIHGAGQFGGHTYLVYELIQGGRSLQDAFEGAALEQRLDWIEQIAAGLSAAHARGIVHRDLKPENVLVRQSGEAVILDFGLAGLDASSLTNTGQALGTPAYMSPEQVRGDPPTPACDVWSLGLLLYEAVYERHAFLEEGITLPLLLAKVYAAQAEFPRGPGPALRRLLQASLDGDPARRPSDGAAFGSALQAARAGSQGASGRRLGLGAGALLACGLGCWALLGPGHLEGRAPTPGASLGPSATRAPSARASASLLASESPPVTQASKNDIVGPIRPRMKLPRPDFRLDMQRALAKQARFVADEEVLFAGKRGYARLYRVGGQAPVALGPAWRLPTASDACLIDTAGQQVVVVSERQAWRLALPARKPIALPELPFVPFEVHLWERGTRFYLLVANDDRVACGVLGAPLRELDVSEYQVREVSGAANRVVILARKLPLKQSGLLIFNLGQPGPAWVQGGTPSAVSQSPEGDRVFLGSRFGSLEVRSGESAGSSTLLVAAHEGSLRHVAWSGDRLAGLSKRSLSIWEASDLRYPLYHDTLPAGGKADELSLSPKGDLVIVRRDFQYLGWRLPGRH